MWVLGFGALGFPGFRVFGGGLRLGRRRGGGWVFRAEG